MGTIGKKLMSAFPSAIGIDRVIGADIVCDLSTVDYSSGVIAEAFRGADAVIHLATSSDPMAPDQVHYEDVINTARLVAACAVAKVNLLILASSDWAQPKDPTLSINTYGHSKRVIEAMAAMFSHSQNCQAVALRIGWVPADPSALVDAPGWLLANHWSDATLIAAFQSAISPG